MPQVIGQLDEQARADLFQKCSRLEDESMTDLGPWLPIVEQNMRAYEWGDDHQPADDKLISHEISCAVIAATDIQTREPLRPKLEPVETGEPPTFYWAGPVEVGFANGLPPECLVPTQQIDELTGEVGESQPPLPLDPMTGEALAAMAISKEQSPALPPGAIRPDWIVALDDRCVADLYQTVFDVIWRRSQSDRFIVKNLFDTNIVGWGFMLYEWDDATKKHKLTHLPIMQVYLDPTCHDVQEAAYAGFSLPMDAAEALASFPELTDVIVDNSFEGQPQQASSGRSTTTFSDTFNKDFQRPIVVFRVMWLRHEQIPMSAEEAVQSGKVEETEVVDDGLLRTELDGANEANAGDDRQDQAEAGGISGQPAVDNYGTVAPPTRLAYLLPSENGSPGAEVTPGSPGWPTRLGILQVTRIGNDVVAARECEFWDIPILHNVNVPLPGARPYGIGEPYRLRSLQRAISGTMTAMVDSAKYHAHPVGVISASMDAALPAKVKELGFAEPGKLLVMPDDQFMAMGGKLAVFTDPPAISPAHLDLLPILKQGIQEMSGNTPTMRGIAPSANASGKMVELLQESGASMMGFKGKRTGQMVERLSNLMLHSLVWRMTPEDIFKIVSKYPIHVLRAICERARQIEWNVTPNVEAGTGATKMAKTQNAVSLFGATLLDEQSAQEMAGLDSRVIAQRKEAALQKQMRMAATMAPPPGEEEPDGEQSDRPAA